MNYSSGNRRGGIVLLTVMLVSAATIPSVVTASSDVTVGPTSSEPVSAFNPKRIAQEAENNTTTRHRKPENVSKDGGLGDIRGWLVDRLSDRLNKGAIKLSQGEYEAAKTILDKEYRDRLATYVDVAGKTDSKRDDRAVKQFNETKEDLDTYISAVQEYRETREEYREARRNGNTTKARRLARQLEKLAERVNETGTTLVKTYRSIENRTGANLSVARRVTRNITHNITTLQAEIRNDLFSTTTLTARDKTEHISFLEPLVVHGQLTTANGTPIENGVIELRAGGRTIRTTTNASGRYQLTYRPTLLELDTDTLTLRYRPRNGSRYLGSNASVSISVEQVRPTIEIEKAPTKARFGDTLVVIGTVSVDGIAAPRVPIVVFVGDHRLGVTRTTADGTFTVTTAPLPADIPSGDRELHVVMPLENRALANTTAITTIAVAETETALTLDGKVTGNRTISLTGQLTTRDGQPIAGQSVAIRIDGRIVETVATNATGAFTETVVVRESQVANKTGNVSITVVAMFDEPGTNLDSAQAKTTVLLAMFDEPGTNLDSAQAKTTVLLPAIDGASRDTLPVWAWMSLGVVLLLGLLGVGYRLQEQSGEPQDESDISVPEESPTPTVDTEEDVEPAGDPLLTLAQERLTEGRTDAAVQASYQAVRSQLESLFETVPQRTHWEFYHACREAGLDEDRLDSLRRLTERYERATFAPESVSVEEATTVVEASQTFDASQLSGDPS